jgi:hypothetical protein
LPGAIVAVYRQSIASRGRRCIQAFRHLLSRNARDIRQAGGPPFRLGLAKGGKSETFLYYVAPRDRRQRFRTQFLSMTLGTSTRVRPHRVSCSIALCSQDRYPHGCRSGTSSLTTEGSRGIDRVTPLFRGIARRGHPLRDQSRDRQGIAQGSIALSRLNTGIAGIDPWGDTPAGSLPGIARDRSRNSFKSRDRPGGYPRAGGPFKPLVA